MGLLVCGRRDLGEEYLCELVDTGQHGHAGRISPIVRVLAVLRYPAQRAIYWPDEVTEISPIRAGCVCRLPFLREATAEDAGRFDSWQQSAAQLQAAYLLRATDARERAILERHQAGQYRPRRSVREYTAHELEAARRAWAAVEGTK